MLLHGEPLLQLLYILYGEQEWHIGYIVAERVSFMPYRSMLPYGEPLLQPLAAAIHLASAYHSVYLASSHYNMANRGRQLSRYRLR